MDVSFGRFGPDTVLFIKPDSALELVKIAHQLGIDLKALEPTVARKGMFGKTRGYKHAVSAEQECFYCSEKYPVKINKQKVWRHVCPTRMCKKKYARDRYLYNTGREELMSRRMLARNIHEMTGIKVTLDKRK